ncbi:MAG TPA: hypothetical protein VGF69_18440 [Thermoanaerobaculia bacterium]|jgi:hypothetical protein
MERIAIARRSARIERLLCEDAGDAAGVLTAPLTALTGDPSYARKAALEVESIARDGAMPWQVRRIAALLFETLLSRIDASATSERRFWLDRLGMTDADELARQGYTRDEPLETQVWRRLARFGRIHRLPLAARRSDRALHDFLHAARGECRLAFSRFLWTPDEVIGRIERDVRRSTGVRDIANHGRFADESAHAINSLPALERAIVEHLGNNAVIRWAALSTQSTLNALVEQPIGTVVLTVKPPGSSVEIEIKRAGLIRDLPLEVVWARNNYILPSSHHLDGGAMHQLLAYEAENSAFFSYIFRAIHGFDASMSRTLYLATVFTIATPKGESDLIEYFTDRRVFGDKYDLMRWNMYEVVKTLAGYEKEQFVEPFNDVALTGSFIGKVKPAQAVQIGTTAFRLERLQRYLSPSGPEHYFRRGLKKDYTPDDARRMVDELLDEVLGQYEPPAVTWRSHQQYVEAAFRVPANRRRANTGYLSAVEHLGRFWGTLLALRAYTRGETFVVRNAGLRSVWRDGKWQVELVLMDHDSLTFASIGAANYRPRDTMANTVKDLKHIFGGVFGTHSVRGELWFLRDIFHIGPTVRRRGMEVLRAAMKGAYDRTHDAMRTDPQLSRHFHESFLRNLRDFDQLVAAYVRTPANRAARKAWREEWYAYLRGRGYNDNLAEEHLKTVTIEAQFLRRLAFLFQPRAVEAAPAAEVRTTTVQPRRVRTASVRTTRSVPRSASSPGS